MSTAFLAPVDLWREPASASVKRVLGRAAIAAAWIILGGVPGVFTGVIPWTWLRVVAWIGAAFALTHFGLAIANLARNKGVILRLMGTGTVEWPRSIQENWLRRPETFVDGPVISVIPDVALSPGAARFVRAKLVGSTRTLRSVPLFGTSAEDFVATLNELAQPRGVSFVVAEPEVPAEDLHDDGERSPAELDGTDS